MICGSRVDLYTSTSQSWSGQEGDDHNDIGEARSTIEAVPEKPNKHPRRVSGVDASDQKRNCSE